MSATELGQLEVKEGDGGVRPGRLDRANIDLPPGRGEGENRGSTETDPDGD